MTERKRFMEFTDEQLKLKRLKVQNRNTMKSNKSTMNQFQAYLKQLNEPENFWDYKPLKLNAYLGKFWFTARQWKLDKDGQEKNTLFRAYIHFAMG